MHMPNFEGRGPEESNIRPILTQEEIDALLSGLLSEKKDESAEAAPPVGAQSEERHFEEIPEPEKKPEQEEQLAKEPKPEPEPKTKSETSSDKLPVESAATLEELEEAEVTVKPALPLTEAAFVPPETETPLEQAEKKSQAVLDQEQLIRDLLRDEYKDNQNFITKVREKIDEWNRTDNADYFTDPSKIQKAIIAINFEVARAEKRSSEEVVPREAEIPPEPKFEVGDKVYYKMGGGFKFRCTIIKPREPRDGMNYYFVRFDRTGEEKEIREDELFLLKAASPLPAEEATAPEVEPPAVESAATLEELEEAEVTVKPAEETRGFREFNIDLSRREKIKPRLFKRIGEWFKNAPQEEKDQLRQVIISQLYKTVTSVAGVKLLGDVCLAAFKKGDLYEYFAGRKDVKAERKELIALAEGIISGLNEKLSLPESQNLPKEGDFVQWTSGGALQFELPKRVSHLSVDGQFVFVEGSDTGLPINELTVTEQAPRESLAVENKKEGLISRINSSKRLTAVQKENYVRQIDNILTEQKEEGERNLADLQERVERLTAAYIHNKISGWVIARDALNLGLTASGLIVLRGAAYAGAAMAERLSKAGQQFEQEREELERAGKGKLGFKLKDLLINSTVETVQGLAFKGKDKEGKKKAGVRKAVDFARSLGSVARLFGIGGASLAAIAEGEKVLNPEAFSGLIKAIEQHDFSKVAGQSAENLYANAQRMYEVYTHPLETIEKGIRAAQMGKGAVEEIFRGERAEGGPKIPSPVAPMDSGGVNTVEPLALKFEADTLKADSAEIVTIPLVEQSAPPPAKAEVFGPPLLEELLRAKYHALPAGIQLKGIVPKDGNVSEVLHRAMASDATVTVINPDGSKIENFDANLVHEGDQILEGKDGEIYVIKESGTTVHTGDSLQARYNEIAEQFKLDEMPKEVKNVFNLDKGKGHFPDQLNFQEAQAARKFWDVHGAKINALAPEQKITFYQKLTPDKSDTEIDKLLTVEPATPESEIASLDQLIVVQKEAEAQLAKHLEEVRAQINNGSLKPMTLAGPEYQSLDLQLKDDDQMLFYDSDNNGQPDYFIAQTKSGERYLEQSSIISNFNPNEVKALAAEAHQANEHLTNVAKTLSANRDEAVRFYRVYQQSPEVPSLAKFVNKDYGILNGFVNRIGHKNLHLLQLDSQYSLEKFELASRMINGQWVKGDIKDILSHTDSSDQVSVANKLLAHENISYLSVRRGLEIAGRVNLNLQHKVTLAELAASSEAEFTPERATEFAQALFGTEVEAQNIRFKGGMDKIIFEDVKVGAGQPQQITIDIKNKLIISGEEKLLELNDKQLKNSQLRGETPLEGRLFDEANYSLATDKIVYLNEQFSKNPDQVVVFPNGPEGKVELFFQESGLFYEHQDESVLLQYDNLAEFERLAGLRH